jgi:hypothetical protein
MKACRLAVMVVFCFLQLPSAAQQEQGELAAGQGVDKALDEFYANGPKPTIVYGPNDPFTLSFRNSLGMQGYPCRNPPQWRCD